MNDIIELLDSMKITKTHERDNVGGTWVDGTFDGYKFCALVYQGHAESESYELNGSRISKLYIRRTTDRKTVFNWDRGMDVAAIDDTAQAIVDFLCEGLADYIFMK